MASRSILFTPGNSQHMMETALASEADVLLFDLEDAIAPDEKATARATVVEMLADRPASSKRIGVRINPVDSEGRADLEALFSGASTPDAVTLPKVNDAATAMELGELLASLNADVRVSATVETAAGVLNAPEIAAVPVVDSLGFGGEDLAAELGATPMPNGNELLYARQRVVVAATAAGVDATDTVYIDYEDIEGLREATEAASRMGFTAKSAIHPVQVATINDVFTPPSDRVEWARRVVDGFEASAAGAVNVDGEMVDEPVYQRARATLDRAEDAGVREHRDDGT